MSAGAIGFVVGQFLMREHRLGRNHIKLAQEANEGDQGLALGGVHFLNFKISNQYDANVVFIVIFNV